MPVTFSRSSIVLLVALVVVVIVQLSLYSLTSSSIGSSKYVSFSLRRRWGDAVTFTGLPAVSSHRRAVFLSSVIERADDEWDLHLAVFVMFREYERRVVSALSGHNKQYFCNIFFPGKVESYTVPATHIPHSENETAGVDILRCRLLDAERVYRQRLFDRPTEHFVVEIVEESLSLVQFSMNWASRRTGLVVAAPPESSQFNAWMSVDSSPSKLQGESHLCVMVDMQLTGDLETTRVLEFVQHHLLVGISHIYLFHKSSWDSYSMGLLLQALKGFIGDGLVSVLSTYRDSNIDDMLMPFVVSGSSVEKTMRNIQVNSCLYLAKGTAEYVGVWDINEFFIPQPPHNSILDVIRSVSVQDGYRLRPEDIASNITVDSWKGGRGWADGDGHPFCYLTLSVDDIPLASSRYMGFSLIGKGRSFHLSRTERVRMLFPTRTIYWAGSNDVAGCRLGKEWTDCDESFEYTALSCQRRKKLSRDIPAMLPGTHNFEEAVFRRDAKLVNRDIGTLHSFNVVHFPYAGGDGSVTTTLYSEKYRPRVADMLQRRGHGISGSNQPYNYSSEDIDVTPLPVVTNDHSEVILGSIIERTHESWDLHVTTFFLNHVLFSDPVKMYLESNKGASVEKWNAMMVGHLKVHPDRIHMWNQTIRGFRHVEYDRNGKRMTQNNYHCRLRHSKLSKSYMVTGEFLPNKQTPDLRSNRRLDVFRCRVQDSQQVYRELIATKEQLLVEIIRGTSHQVAKFFVPWKSRRAGYVLNAPSDASQFNAWKGYNPTSSALPGVVGGDVAHLCAAGLISPFSQQILPLIAEFIQHHLLLGFDHVFLTAAYAWEGSNMKMLKQAFQHFIKTGKLSVASQSTYGIDYVPELLGLSMSRDNANIYSTNMCLYTAKGTADYVGIWDFDEFFIPKPPHFTLSDVLRRVESPTPLMPLPPDTDTVSMKANWEGGKGWADGDGHPYCYLMLQSEVLFRPPNAKDVDDPRIFVGLMFGHAPETKRTGLEFKKSLLPTRRIFQAGLHMAGGCKLVYPFSGCGLEQDNDFCYMTQETIENQYPPDPPFELTQQIDGLLMDKDAKKIDPNSEASIYHFQVHRKFLKASKVALEGPRNFYLTRFFARVYSEVKRNRFEVLASVPDSLSVDCDFMKHNWMLVAYDSIGAIRHGNARLQPEPVAELPAFASDESEIALSGIIEYGNSGKLYASTVLLSHQYISNRTAFTSYLVHPDHTTSLRKFVQNAAGTRYTLDGKRNDGHSYTCRLTSNGHAYVVEGEFLFNDLTNTDANKHLDIFRCPIQDSGASHRFDRSEEKLRVEVFRDSYLLVKYDIPWKSRRTGFMVDSRAQTSLFDAWGGPTDIARNSSSNVRAIISLVVDSCVPFTKSSLADMAEFIQHHITVGFEHVFMSVPYRMKNSAHWGRLIDALRPYILDGKLSLASHVSGDRELAGYVLGIAFDDIVLRGMHATIHSRLFHGAEGYIVSLPMDEYVVPVKGHSTISQALRQTSDYNVRYFCHVSFLKLLVASRNSKASAKAKWKGESFKYSVLSQSDESVTFHSLLDNTECSNKIGISDTVEVYKFVDRGDTFSGPDLMKKMIMFQSFSPLYIRSWLTST